MKILQLVIETNENYQETSLFPWLSKSQNNVIVRYDAIPIKYLDKQYIITLAFPYKYNFIHLENTSDLLSEQTASQNNSEIFKVNLIHSSNELNLAIYSCDKYTDFSYTINDLKYKIPSAKFNDYYFKNNDKLISIEHIDYYFANLDALNLPPLAYLKCQAEPTFIGSVLFNLSNQSIYGILQTTTDHHIVIPAISIKRLLDGINTGFQYSNFFCDYKLHNNLIQNGIKIVNSQYSNLHKNDIVLDINNNMIIRGNIRYPRINEWVPIEVYMWYEWLPNTTIRLNMHSNIELLLPFINYNKIMSIPMYNTNNYIETPNSTTKLILITFQLLKYFYNNNVILRNNVLDEYLLNPYNSDTNEYKQLYIELDEKLLTKKYLEPTEYTDFVISS
jgi:hypothetical protein